MRKIMLAFAVFLILLSITAVSAQDNTTVDTVSQDIASDSNTFTDLQNQIKNPKINAQKRVRILRPEICAPPIMIPKISGMFK